MKYLYFYISTIFLKFVNCVKPFIEKYIPCNTQYIIKSLSGLLRNTPYMNNQIEENKLLCNSEKECDLQSKKCNQITFVPGYMEHDPKGEVLRTYKHKCFFFNSRKKSHSL